MWLGNVSFAFYLVHQLTIRWVHDAFGATRSFGTPEAIGITALALAVSLLVATVLCYGVELPLVRRFSTAKQSRPDPAVTDRAPAQLVPAGTGVPAGTTSE